MQFFHKSIHRYPKYGGYPPPPCGYDGLGEGGVLTYIWLVAMCDVMDPLCNGIFPKMAPEFLKKFTDMAPIIEHSPLFYHFIFAKINFNKTSQNGTEIAIQ